MLPLKHIIFGTVFIFINVQQSSSRLDFTDLCANHLKLVNFNSVVIYTDAPQEFYSSSCLKQLTETGLEVVPMGRFSLFQLLLRLDQDYATAIIINLSPENLAMEMSQVSSSLQEFKLAHPTTEGLLWDPIYFFLWPETSQATTNTSNSGGLTKDFQKFLSHFAPLFPFNSDVFWIHDSSPERRTNPTPSPFCYHLWETYFIKSASFVNKVCDTLENPRCFQNFLGETLERRRNFHRIPIIATAVIDPVYSHEVSWLQQSNSKPMLADGGSAVEYYRLIRDRLNFTEDAIIGEYMLEGEENSTAEEMQIYLYDGRADLAITESGIASNKAQLVHFLHATTANRLEATVSHVPGTKWEFLLGPFSKDVWRVLVAYCLFFGIAMTTSRRLTSKKIRETLQAIIHTCSTLHLSLLWAIGTLCQQGWYKWPKRLTLKILLIVASASGFMILTAYSAKLTSQLAVKEPVTVTFEKLLNSSFKYFMENDFDFPADTTKYHVQVNTLYGVEASVPIMRNMVSERKQALISYPDFFYAATIAFGNMSEVDVCNSFTRISTSYYPVLCSMAVRKWSPFKDIFNVHILRAYHHGTWDRTSKIYESKTRINCETLPAVIPQELGQLAFAYGTLFAGIGFALASMTLEILCFRFRYSQRSDSGIFYLQKQLTLPHPTKTIPK